MAHLIDKDKLEAFLNELRENLGDSDYDTGYLCAIDSIFGCYLNSLEAKEVNLDFEQELYKAFGQVKDFTLGMRIAKHFFELGLKAAQKGEHEDKTCKENGNYLTQELPVSEELEEAAENYASTDEVLPNGKVMIDFQAEKAFKAGANWQKQQMMKEAISGHVGQTINGMLRALSDETFGDMGFTAGDKVKLIIIKED